MNIVIKNGVCFVLFICTFFSCKKETYQTRYDELLPRNNGVVTVLLNGQEWKSNICRASYLETGTYVSSDTVNLTASIFVNGYERQNISIAKINLLSSLQKIQPAILYDSVEKTCYLQQPSAACNSLFFPMDIDVPENVYWIYENEITNNYIVIEEYNPVTKKVKGSFEAHYATFLRQTPLTPGLPDTLHFTNGKFEFQLK